MVCSKCKKEINDNTKFCDKCDEEVTGNNDSINANKPNNINEARNQINNNTKKQANIVVILFFISLLSAFFFKLPWLYLLSLAIIITGIIKYSDKNNNVKMDKSINKEQAKVVNNYKKVLTTIFYTSVILILSIVILFIYVVDTTCSSIRYIG